MEFPFRLAAFLGAPPDCTGPYVGAIDEAKLRGPRGQDLCQVLEALGKASGAAQGLRKPVTTGMPHLPSQRVYLLASGRTALGFLKVGPKRLFVTSPPSKSSGSRPSVVGDALREVTPVCALDFYVHESCQRNGYGRKLFEAMLSCEGLQAAQLAYDRPSPKLKAFLAKHYGLTRFRPQNNNYVIFDDYFEPSHRGAPLPDTLPISNMGEPRQLHDQSRPPLPHHGYTAPDPIGLQQSSLTQSHPGLGMPLLAQERGRTPRAASGSSGGQSAAGPAAPAPPPWGTHAQPLGAGHVVSLQTPCSGTPASGYGGRTAGPAPLAAGMPSAGSRAGSQRARSTSAPLSAMGSSRSRVSSAGTDSGVGASLGRGSAANRFESPLSHAGRSMMMR